METSEDNALHASRVEHSLAELQQAVRDHEAALRKVRWFYLIETVSPASCSHILGTCFSFQPVEPRSSAGGVFEDHESGL